MNEESEQVESRENRLFIGKLRAVMQVERKEVNSKYRSRWLDRPMVKTRPPALLGWVAKTEIYEKF